MNIGNPLPPRYIIATGRSMGANWRARGKSYGWYDDGDDDGDDIDQ